MAIRTEDFIGMALASDPYDERPGLWMDQAGMDRLKALPECTWLKVIHPNGLTYRFPASDMVTLEHLPQSTQIFQDGLEPDLKAETVWLCKIGVSRRLDLPEGSDNPLRKAVKAAFEDLTGMSGFCFSGWGGTLTIAEQVVVGQVKIDESRYLYPGPGGALMSSHEIEGLTQRLGEPSTNSTARYYGGRYMICETMKPSAQRKIAEALGVSYRDKGPCQT